VTRGPRTFAAGLAAAVAAAACAAPAGADVQISHDSGAQVAAYGGVQAWLRKFFANGRQQFRLVLRRNGVAADAPIRSFVNDVPGIDLGPGTTPGSIVAVYTRCSGDVFSQRCSVDELDLASGRERRVPGLSSRHASAVNPTTWAGFYAFGRVPIGHGHGHVKRRYGLFAGSAHARRVSSRSPIGADMDASTIAYAAAKGTTTEIRVHRVHGRSDCRIERRHEDLHRPRNDNTVDDPVLSGGYVYWILHGSLGTSPVRVRRVPVPGPNCHHAPIEAAAVDLPPVSGGLAIDGTNLYYANAHGVFEADLPAFAPAA
jgi:opacity protein-like surface antigen